MAQSTITRLADSSRLKPKPGTRKGTRSSLASILILARWQLRQTWRLLLITGAGTLLAVILVCAIPLYAQVSMSAGLRHTLESNPQNLALTVHSQSSVFSSSALEDIQQEISQIVQQALGSAISATPLLSVQVPTLSVNNSTQVRLVGTDEKQVKGHLKLLQGRLPDPSATDVVEYVLTQEAERDLHLPLNSIQTFAYPMNYTLDKRIQHTSTKLKLQLVGVIDKIDGDPLFWHGESLEKEIYFSGLATVTRYPLLVSNTGLMQAFDKIVKASRLEVSRKVLLETNENPGLYFVTNPEIYWYYNFDFSHIDINQLANISNALNSLLTNLSHHPESPPQILNTTAIGPLNVLLDYSNRITVLQLPILCLAFFITALALFFVLLITNVLIERHVEAITLLRSRGASGRQVFGSLLGQSAGMGIITFLVGPFLAILLAILLASLTLNKREQASLELITAHPLTVAQGLIGRDLLVVGIALIVSVLAVWQAIHSNILVLQREGARSTSQPFWMRFKLDILAACVALLGFGLSLYIGSPGVLNLRTRTLIIPLTSLVGTLSLLIGCLLLFLRIFRPILRRGEQIAARNKGAAPLLAIAQMARSPRQALRTTLLFALAVAFSLFTLIFSVTQEQRLTDLTTYQVGSDFSGNIPSVLSSEDWDSQLQFYRDIKGISSVTLGDRAQLAGGSDQSILIDLEAVDSGTYASTLSWTDQNGQQSISELMKQLGKRYEEAVKSNVIPAILDDNAAKSLNVGPGQQFVLSDFHGPMSYMVMDIVHYLPTIYDALDSSTDSSISQGGILVDFATYRDIAMAVNSNGITPTVVWLRAGGSLADLDSARQILFSGTYALENGLDRQKLTSTLATDPLYATVIGILIIGTGIALLLGFLGNLIVSWLSVRERRTSFAVLRALGCAPGQIVQILIWEQSIVYSTALVLGIALSILFSLTVLPAFIFSPLLNTDTAESFYMVQSTPPVQIVVPILPLLYTLAGLIGICILGIGMMKRVVSRPQISQALRINED